MARYNPFSFKGEIGRAKFWLFVLLANVVLRVTETIPVVRHQKVTYPLGGIETIAWATPREPATAASWAFLALFYALATVSVWIFLSAATRRLRDLDHSPKWLLAFLALIAANLTLETLFSRPDASYSLFEFLNLAILIPAIGIGTFGLLQMMLISGITTAPRSAPGDLGEMEPS